MKQFYKVRVVEDRVNESCTVQVKHRWFSSWEVERLFDNYNCKNEQHARENAIAYADRLMQSQVIYEVK